LTVGFLHLKNLLIFVLVRARRECRHWRGRIWLILSHSLSTDYADFRRTKKISRAKTQRRKDAKTLRGEEYPQVSVDENNLSNRCNLRINVCDAEPYEFNRIIEVFRESGIRPRRPVISVPLSVVWVATRIAGCLLRNKKEWVYSCYDKLASDLVFDNGRMMGTGFRAVHSLETIMGDRGNEEGRPERACSRRE